MERYPLTFGPTPIEKLSRLGAHLGKQIWAKREDCNSGLAFGGNKLRKLEYLIPDALAQGADALVTIGGVQSNHTRQVAAVAAKLGMKCVLVQGSWVETHEPTYDRVGNLLLSRVLGADILFSREDFSIAIKESWTAAIEDVKKSGGKPYPIPAGASDHPLGGVGYYFFGDELRAQEEALGFRFDVILFASASGSTQGGMVVGLPDREIIGIDVTARPADTRAQIEKIAARTADRVGKKAGPVRLEEGYAYPAYGIPSKETLIAIRLAARLEGMITDPVYEGKSMQALIDMRFPPETRILYVHLGGAPALDAYAEALNG